MTGKINNFKIVCTIIAISLALSVQSLLAESTVKDHRTNTEIMDSVENFLPYMEQKVLSTLMFGGSAPVQFAGDARLKGQYHLFTTYPDYLGPHTYEEGDSSWVVSGERSYLQTGWEESFIRFGLIARAGRNTILWSRFGFAHTFPGNRVTNIGGGLTPTQLKSLWAMWALWHWVRRWALWL